jgi:type II secretory pathway component PulF
MFSSITHLEKLLFTRELSVLLKSGVPLGETLQSLWQKTKPGALRNIIETLLSNVENGQSFAHALERFPKVFDPLYINLVKLGEASGTLRENLDFLTRQLEGAYTLRKKIQGIVLYPMIVFSMALIPERSSIFHPAAAHQVFDS